MTSSTSSEPLSEQQPDQQPSQASHRVFIEDGFAWDAQGAYLFDIDGTLLRSRDAVHYHSFFNAVEAVMARQLSLEGVVLHGNTDPGILRDAFRQAGVEDADWRGSSDAVFAHMGQSVQAHRAEMDLVVMPGVEATLEYLQRAGAALGVATGNLQSIGWIKVEEAGLRDWFTFGGFSDGFEARADMIAHALRVAHKAAGPSASVCVIGDTPADVAAARANGLPTIAVATGTYTFDELMESRPEACVSTLEALLLHAQGLLPAGGNQQAPAPRTPGTSSATVAAVDEEN